MYDKGMNDLEKMVKKLIRERDLLVSLLSELDVGDITDESEDFDYEIGQYKASFGFSERVEEALLGIEDLRTAFLGPSREK